MIEKSDLKGKYITFIDKDGKFRTNKVIKIIGNTLTVKDAIGRRRRIKMDKVIGRQTPKKLEEIEK